MSLGKVLGIGAMGLVLACSSPDSGGSSSGTSASSSGGSSGTSGGSTSSASSTSSGSPSTSTSSSTSSTSSSSSGSDCSCEVRVNNDAKKIACGSSACVGGTVYECNDTGGTTSSGASC